MKKNLQLALALVLGIATTASAQDWSVDSRSRVDMSGDNSQFLTDQQFRVGTSFGGENWGVNVSTDVNYQLSDGSNDVETGLSATIHEAYASTNLMGYTTLTVGRRALEFGDGSIIGANNWGKRAQTRDGFTAGFEMSDVNLIVIGGTVDYGFEQGVDYLAGSYFGANATGSMSSISYDATYVSQTTSIGTYEEALTVLGVNAMFETMGATITGTFNSIGGDYEGDMMMAHVSYPVSDDLTIHGSFTQYGDNGFGILGSNTGANTAIVEYDDIGQITSFEETNNSWFSHGNMGFLDAKSENLSFGGSYAMGDFSVGATMHMVSNDDFEMMDGSDYERNVTELNLGYSINDNSSFSIKYATDDNRFGLETEETYMWATLKIGM